MTLDHSFVPDLDCRRLRQRCLSAMRVEVGTTEVNKRFVVTSFVKNYYIRFFLRVKNIFFLIF